jgi:hypothetical protein
MLNIVWYIYYGVLNNAMGVNNFLMVGISTKGIHSARNLKIHLCPNNKIHHLCDTIEDSRIFLAGVSKLSSPCRSR